MNNRRNTTLLVGLLVAALAAVAVFLAIKVFTSYKLVTVQYADGLSGVTAKIYNVDKKNDEVSLNKLVASQQPVKQVTANSSFKLRSGDYVLITEGNGYVQNVQPFTLTGPQTLTVDPDYTPEKLAEMLVPQKATIDNIIATTVPNFSNQYKISNGKLYGQGEWYGAIIEPNISAEQAARSYNDRFGVVARKDSKGEWKVVTIPPEIILSSVKYPQIPIDTLIDINNQTVPNN